MDQPLDIRDVVKRTGLTSRALRFYEARGLLKPLRTYSGRRLYGRGELERIQQILALKRAGLSLAQIGKLTARGNMDLGAIVDAQLKVIEERKAELDEARALLLSVKSRIDRGEPVDAETFCSLIRQGDKIMEAQDWKKVTDRYFSPEEKGALDGENEGGAGRVRSGGIWPQVEGPRRPRRGGDSQGPRTARKRRRYTMNGRRCWRRLRRSQRPR